MGPLTKLEKNPRFHKAFRQLGDDWNVTPQMLKELEQFTCLMCMYGQSRQSSVDVVRAILLHKMVWEDEKLAVKSRVDLTRLPPCRSALKPHIQRVNHRTALYKRAHEPSVEKPKPYDEGQGWMRTAKGVLKPLWLYNAVLPNSLVDLLDIDDPDDDQAQEEGTEEEDFRGFIDSDDE